MMVVGNVTSGHKTNPSQAGNSKKLTHQQRHNQSVRQKTQTARLLVLGDKRVGKSAAIVRYTTGRYIQDYSNSTSNWLYRHSLGFEAKRNSTTLIELLELKDTEFCNFSTNKQPTDDNHATDHHHQQQQHANDTLSLSLSSRVARDQQLAAEQQNKKEMLNKLCWANAYIVIYAINDVTSFNKAIKYLNFIANNIINPIDRRKGGSLSGRGSISSNSSINSYNSSTNFSAHKLSAPSSNRSQPQASNSHSILNTDVGLDHCGYQQSINASTSKRPILLLGNKSDLERNGRQVSLSDGRLLAMRHQALFTEISIAESSKLIESSLASLLDQIEPSSLHLEHSSHLEPLADTSQAGGLVEPPLNRAASAIELALEHTSASSLAITPIWASLVRSACPKPAVAQSSIITSAAINASSKASVVRSVVTPLGSLARSVESARVCQPMVSCSLAKGAKEQANQAQQPNKVRWPLAKNNQQESSHATTTYHDRYENLKSSFKKASMAIVSSKALVRGTKHTASKPTKLVKPQAASSIHEMVSTASELGMKATKKNSLDSQQSITSASCTSEPAKNDIAKTDIAASTTSIENTSIKSVPNDNSISLTSVASQSVAKRPLFSYISRRKTVAFDREVDSDSAAATTETHESQLDETLDEIEDDFRTGSSCDFSSPIRYSSGRSSSSLSNSDQANQHNSLFILASPERSTSSTSSGNAVTSSTSSQSNYNPIGAYRNRTHRDSRSNLSYTSSGSCDNGGSLDLNNQLLNGSTMTLNKLKSSKQILSELNNRGGKKKNQLVRTVQNTFSNLTRSSNISGQAAKRSICNTLFKHSTPDASMTIKKITPPEVGLAKTESIPKMVAVCK